jgi:hypothetical protein
VTRVKPREWGEWYGWTSVKRRVGNGNLLNGLTWTARDSSSPVGVLTIVGATHTFVEPTGGAIHFCGIDGVPNVAGGPLVWSFLIRDIPAGSNRNVIFEVYKQGTGDKAAGIVGLVDGGNAWLAAGTGFSVVDPMTVTNMGGGFFQIDAHITVPAGALNFFKVLHNGSDSYAGDGVSGFEWSNSTVVFE